MRYSDFKIVEGKGEDMLAKADTLLQGTGFARKGFEVVKAPQQGSVRGSITDEALAMVKNMLAKAKAMGATEPAAVKPTMNPADVTDKEFSESEDESKGLEAGPPYPRRDKDAVKDMQRKLQDLSYSVGNTGVDGKYGPRTTRAVRAFKADYDISTPATKMSAEELRILASAKPKEDPTPVRAPSRGREGSGRRARSALGFFIEKGLSPEQSAGIVGNLQAESGQGLDPSAVGDGGQAHGIAQWHPPRRRNFERAFGKPFSESSFEEQLEFIWWELNNTERRAMRLLRRAESAEQAAYIFDKYYERSSGAHRRRRMQYAARLLAANPGTAVV